MLRNVPNLGKTPASMGIMAIITFIIIANFVTPTVISGTDTGSTLIKAVFLLVVAAIVNRIATFISNYELKNIPNSEKAKTKVMLMPN